jgi:hypothetical protein
MATCAKIVLKTQNFQEHTSHVTCTHADQQECFSKGDYFLMWWTKVEFFNIQ